MTLKNPTENNSSLIAAGTYFRYWYCIFLPTFSRTPSLFHQWDKKRYHGIKNDMAGHMVSISPFYGPDTRTTI